MFWAAGLALAAGLSGCGLIGSPQYEAVRSDVIENVRQFNDRVIEDGRLLTCDAPSAGALQRSYWQTQAGLDAWWAFCVTFNPLADLEPPEIEP
jgi:hypothetical protein